jgi:hypothetical protein
MAEISTMMFLKNKQTETVLQLEIERGRVPAKGRACFIDKKGI